MDETYWLYMVKMVPPHPVELIIADEWEFKDDRIAFYRDNKKNWTYVNKAHWTTIECLGKCDKDGKVLNND